MVQTIVVGLDGGTWCLLDEWISDGFLPNIGKILDEGVHADLRSELPPVTFPNWRCMTSGKNPGKFGVYWWERVDVENQSIQIPNSREFKTADYWDYLNREGLSTGIINMPGTYPPFEIDGFMISGGPDAGDREYCSPSSLEARLEDEFSYSVHPPIRHIASDTSHVEDTVQQMLSVIESRFEISQVLMDQVDVLQVTITYNNVLQHHYWNGSPTKRAWESIDEGIGILAERANNVVLVSDHGCGPLDYTFNLNAWLKVHGHLQYEKSSISEHLLAAGVTQNKIYSLFDRFSMGAVALRMARNLPLRNLIPVNVEGVKREGKASLIDWDGSDAVASGSGLVYFLTDDISVQAEIRDGLKAEKHNGRRVFEAVHDSSDVYDGSFVNIGPDLVCVPRPCVRINDFTGGSLIFNEKPKWKGGNLRTGIFAASGEAFETIDERLSMDIKDVAPTLLHSLNAPVADDMDGTVRHLTLSNSQPGTHESCAPIEISPRSSKGVDESVRQRLERIGYLE